MIARALAGMVAMGLLSGCRGTGAPSGEGEGRVEAKAAAVAKAEPVVETKAAAEAKAEPIAVPEPVVAPGPAVAPEPKRTAFPDPKVIDDQHVRVAGRAVEVRIDEEQQPQRPPSEDSDDGYVPPKLSLAVALDGATSGEHLLVLPTGFGDCYQKEAVVEPVRGPASPLVLAQAFCEDGEDEFSRQILAFVIHVGDAATAPRVLWQGEGHYYSSFDVCEDIDVSSVEIVEPGTVVIDQVTEVVRNRNPDRLPIRCKSRKEHVRRLAELAY